LIELFGWLFKRKEDKPEPPSFAPREVDDGATIVSAGGVFGTFIDLDGTVRSEAEVVTRYRDMAQQPEIDNAVDEICNEMIASNFPVKIILDDLKQNDTVKTAIEEAFDDVIELLDFRHHGYDIIKRWYIDGRLYIHTIIDEQKPDEGIQELRMIDPRKIRKIREVIKRQVRGAQVGGADAVLTQTKNEYFMYSDKGFNLSGKMTGAMSGPSTGIKIAKDAIVHVTSGLTDTMGTLVLSYLHKAIKPLNQLRTLEDAAIIYRLSRSPERRIWYIDVGNLPKLKAEQYVKDIMTKHKNKLNYDAVTGEIQNDRKFITMLEDYWLPQRDGKGTKVDVLPPGAAFNQLDDILFFQKRLYNSLHVPINRLDPDNIYSDSVATQITRDEVKFGKFIDRMRVRFAQLFTKVLEKQLVLKQVMSIEDFEKVSRFLKYDFVKDNYFLEGKEQQIMMSRIEIAMQIMPFIGRYYSNTWMRKNVLRQNDEEIKEMDMEILEEQDNPQYAQPMGGDQQDDPNNPAVVADDGSFGNPMMQQQPPGGGGGGKPNGGSKPVPAPKKKTKQPDASQNKKQPAPVSKTSPKGNFKSVAKILSKGT